MKTNPLVCRTVTTSILDDNWQCRDKFLASLPINFCARLNRQSSILKSPPEDHAVKSTVHITDSPETCHNCTTSLAH